MDTSSPFIQVILQLGDPQKIEQSRKLWREIVSEVENKLLQDTLNRTLLRDEVEFLKEARTFRTIMNSLLEKPGKMRCSRKPRYRSNPYNDDDGDNSEDKIQIYEYGSHVSSLNNVQNDEKALIIQGRSTSTPEKDTRVHQLITKFHLMHLGESTTIF